MPKPQELIEAAVATALQRFAPAGLQADDLAVTLTDLRGRLPAMGHHRGNAPFYPASVIKLFYLVAAHQWLEDGKISYSAELSRALHDMIAHSSNDATGYVVDVLTQTTSGPELAAGQLAAWRDKRESVNRYFRARGYADVNAFFKTWDEAPYGRDKQAADQVTPGRNVLTTNSTARLLADLATGRWVSPERCHQMLDLMKRDFTNAASPDEQAREYIGMGLPPGANLWSKAGETSQMRHDAAIVELPGERRFVLAVFTTRPDLKGIIPEIARQVTERF